MLKDVANVRDGILKTCAGHECDLQTITNAFVAYTVFDRIDFVPYDTPVSNPIIGEFTRWHMLPAPYSASQSIVEVRYAKHLSQADRRLVVCKELCHALEAPTGVHVVSDEGIQEIVEAFSIQSSNEAPGKVTVNVALETVAMVGALEILYPIQERLEILKGGMPDEAGIVALAQKYQLQPHQIEASLQPSYIEIIQGLMNGAR